MSDRFEDNVKKNLAAGAGRVDQRTRDELARRRRLALDAGEKTASRHWLWLPAGVAAAALVAVWTVWPMLGDQGLPVAAVDENELDMEILLAEESLELFEDLEFYEWLDATGDAG